jgi:hypothetical protein
VQQQNAHSPKRCVRITSGGVGERLKPAVLKTTWRYYLSNLSKSLRYVLVPILGTKRPELEGKCATDCATFRKVCNRTNKTLGPTEEGMFQGIDAAAAVAVCQFILPCSYSLPLICSEPLSVRSFAQNHPICRLLCTNCAPRKFFLTHPGCCCRRQVHDRGPCWM